MYIYRAFFVVLFLLFSNSFSSELWKNVSILNEKLELKKLNSPVENIKDINEMDIPLLGYSVKVKKLKVEYRKNGFTWFGKVKDDDFSTVIFTVQDGYLFGIINFFDKHYRVEPYSNNVYVLSEEYNFEEPLDKVRINTSLNKDNIDLSFTEKLKEKDKYIDLLILYTKKVKDLWGDALNAYVQNLVDIINAALENSKIEVRINLVGTIYYDTPDVNENINTVLARLYIRDDEEIKSIRDKYKADILVLLREKDLNSNSVKCGITNGIFKLDKLYPDWKNNIKQVIDYYKKTTIGIIEVNKIYDGIQKNGNYCSELYFAHHIAHSLGCDHNRENVSCGTGQAFHYSFAYKGTQNFFTLTSPNNPKILYLSDPDTFLNDEHIGIGDNEEKEPADNKRTVMYTSYIISNFEVANRYPKAYVEPDKLIFSDISKREKKISIYNYGDRDLKINISTNSNYLKILNTCSVVKQYQKCDIKLSLITSGIEEDKSYIFIKTNDPYKNTIKIPVYIKKLSYKKPIIDISLNEIEFGDVLLNQNKSLSFIVKNKGKAELILQDVHLQNRLFSIRNNCSILKENETCVISIDFKPESEKEYKDYLIIVTNDSENPQLTIPISGGGKKLNIYDFEVSSKTVNFGNVLIGSEKFFILKIKNTGDTNQSFTIVEDSFHTSDFNITSNCSGTVLPGEECSLSIRFSPTSEIFQNFSFNIKGINGKGISVSVKGKGILPPQKRINVLPIKLEFETDINKSITKQIKIMNIGNTSVKVNKLVLYGDSFSAKNLCQEIGLEEECKIDVSFSPKHIGIFEGKLLLKTDAENGKEIPILLTGKAYGEVNYEKNNIKIDVKNTEFILEPREIDIPEDKDITYIKSPIEYSFSDAGLPIEETVYIPVTVTDNDIYIRVFYEDGTFKDIPVHKTKIVLKLKDGSELDSDKRKNGEILRKYAVIKKMEGYSDKKENIIDNPTNNNINNSSGSGGCSFNKKENDFTLLYTVILILALALRKRLSIIYG